MWHCGGSVVFIDIVTMGDELTLKFFNQMIFNPFLAEVETHVVFTLLSLWIKS